MQFSKSTFLPMIGLIVLIFFIVIAYLNNHFLLDELMLCSFILGLVFFSKMKSESHSNQSNLSNTKYTDPT
jgi:hypothetical protein